MGADGEVWPVSGEGQVRGRRGETGNLVCTYLRGLVTLTGLMGMKQGGASSIILYSILFTVFSEVLTRESLNRWLILS